MVHTLTEEPGRLPAWVLSWLRDPLVHFLFLGAALFILYGLLSSAPDGIDAKRITVSRDALLNFAQYRANTFQFDLFDQSLDDLTAVEREALVAEYVREEALYREAIAMGLDQGDDYVIRQRLIQRLEFLFEDNIETADVGRDELMEFYTEFSADYIESDVYTFTHVFFNVELRGDAEAREAATQLLAELNEQSIPFSGSLGLGDRPLYFQNYIERTGDFVKANLGKDLISMLDHVEPSSSTWYGPMHSPYGWHLVLLTARRSTRLPDLEEIEDRVREDYERMRLAQARRSSIDQIIDSYEVKLIGLDPELRNAESVKEEN
jgi:hypothetical protein